MEQKVLSYVNHRPQENWTREGYYSQVLGEIYYTLKKLHGFLQIYAQEWDCRMIWHCNPMYSSQTWKQPECPLTAEWIRKMWCIYTLEYGMHAKSLSHIQLFVKLWTVACQAHLSMGFSRQESWDGLLCPPPGDFPNPGIESISLMSPALEVNSLPLVL